MIITTKSKTITRITAFVAVFFFTLFFLKSPDANTKILGDTDTLTSSKIIELINKERTENQLPPLLENISLTQAAADKAQNMVETGNFEHSYQTSSGLIEPWQFILNQGYNYAFAGENLAKDFDSPEVLIRAWMDSPGHKANILAADYQEIGVSVLTGSYFDKNKTSLIVVFFATPQIIAQTQTPQSFTSTQMLIPKTAIIDIIAAINPRYILTITALTIFVALTLWLDYTHHRKPTKPSLKHWRKR